MCNELSITRAQVTNALSRLRDLRRSSPTPMARFLTDRPGLILEVEHLETNGEEKLNALLEAGKSEVLTFSLDGLTGSANQRQFFVRVLHAPRRLSNSTYVRRTNIRNVGALNVFAR